MSAIDTQVNTSDLKEKDMRLLPLAATVLLLSPLTATAQAAGGMGPVYQALQGQGFTNMQTVRDRNRNRIRVTAQRGD
ncbi:hypothetical protein, partial [Solirhodobacter olei]|uniref:hypothetical protein n=1 Tax=Solirhodobacter olei TaxID=2493082 RepID=UPI0019D46B60